MVSALDSGSNGPGLSPGWGTALCSWARHFTLCDGLASHPRWSRNTPSRSMLRKPG